jgi:N,N'-diacetyllegionaminate synthase
MYIYVETAFHHEGDKSYLFKLIEAAKESEVNGVKFQVLINLDEFMSSRHSAYTQAKTWILSIEDWREVFAYTQALGLELIIMPLDIAAFAFVSEFNVRFLEIHSVSFNDTELLLELEKYKTPLILGTGGRTQEEIDAMVKRFSNRDIILMIGFQSYPSKLVDVSIGKIKQFKNLYQNCLIGYADHSSFDDPMAITSNEYAYILGARIFEKHITINEGCDRIDFQSAVSSIKIKKIKKNLSYLESLKLEDSGVLSSMNDKESVYRSRQKAPVANKDLNAGIKIIGKDFDLKMIDADDKIEEIKTMIGKKLKNIVLLDNPVSRSDI